jgi:hypothetical protein
MKNEIAILGMSEIKDLSKIYYESGMFTDAKSAAQAFVKIQAGQEIGLSPFASMSGINVIVGKPTFGAGVIASAVKNSAKYDFKVKELTDLICSIDFFEGKEFIGNSTFTIADAKKQATKNLEKFPRNMLYARAMSNGQKWFCPDVFQMAVYVPEEMQEITENITHEIIETPTVQIPETTTTVTVETPTLTDTQLSGIVKKGIDRMQVVLQAINEGKLNASPEQKESLQQEIAKQSINTLNNTENE